jgi:hypothetical protein
MLIRKKINIKKYLWLSTIHMGITYFIVNNAQEYFVVLLVFVATVINQWMLIESVNTMVQSAAGKPTEDTSSSVMMFLVKTLMLLVVLSFGVHFMGKRIIIPLLNYVIQIFILYFSFRQKDCEQ